MVNMFSHLQYSKKHFLSKKIPKAHALGICDPYHKDTKSPASLIIR